MEISKISVSGTTYDVKDANSRMRLTGIETGTTILTKVATTPKPAQDGGTIGDVDVGGDLNVSGNITQQGSSYETHAEKVFTKNDIIITRDGAVSGLTTGQYSGIRARLYDGTNDGLLAFDKDGIARVGDYSDTGGTIVDDTQAIATREDVPLMNGMPYWSGNGSSATGTFLTTLPTFNTTANNSDIGGMYSVFIPQLKGYIDGLTLKVLFPSGAAAGSLASSTNALQLDIYTVLNNGAPLGPKPIYVNKNGTPSAISYHTLERTAGVTRNWYLQEYTTLELRYISSLNNNSGAWLVIGNPVVLSSSTEGYTICADGLSFPSPPAIGELWWTKKGPDQAGGNPSKVFPGTTWSQITDKFILAAGTTYTYPEAGGSSTTTLSVENLPSHSHSLNNHTHSFTPQGTIIGGAYSFSGTKATLKATAGGTISGGAYSFSGTKATLKATAGGTIIIVSNPKFTPDSSQRTNEVRVSHRHLINRGNTSSTGTTAVAGFRGIVSTTGGCTTTQMGTLVVQNTGYKSASGLFSLGTDTISAATGSGVSSKTTATLNITNHQHQVTAAGYLYGYTEYCDYTASEEGTSTLHSHAFSPTGTISGGAYDFQGTEHSHTYTPAGSVSVSTNPTFTGTEHSHTYTPAGSVSVSTQPNFSGTNGTTGVASGNTGSTGSGTAFNNMPPYIVRYCWERTA